MDKQDELAGAVQEALPRVHILVSDGLYHEASEQIAAAVRSFMGSDGVVERAGVGVREYLSERTGFGTDEGVVAAYYGGNWVTLNTNKIARAALSAAIGEDIGGGRG